MHSSLFFQGQIFRSRHAAGQTHAKAEVWSHAEHRRPDMPRTARHAPQATRQLRRDLTFGLPGSELAGSPLCACRVLIVQDAGDGAVCYTGTGPKLRN